MTEEIMLVVNKHISKSEENDNLSSKTDSINDNEDFNEYATQNRFGRKYCISDEKMRRFKEEYRKQRVDLKTILDEVRQHPIDTSQLETSFDIDYYTSLIK